MLAKDMYQHPDVGFYTPRPYIKNQYTGIRYAEKTPYELLDLFLPDSGDGPFPLVIDVHGGGFYYGSRSSVRMEPVLNMIKRGYVVATFDYTLSPYGKFPLQIQELKAAIRYLKANASKYKIDSSHIGLWGLSAGAHIVTLTALSPHVPKLDDPSMGNNDFDPDVQAVVELYGPTLLDSEAGGPVPGEDQSLTVYGVLFGADPRKIPEKVALADPCNHITQTAPPFFMQYGTNDSLVALENGLRLRDRLAQVIGSQYVFFEIIPGAEHADDLFRTPENTEKIYRFFDKYLKHV